MALRGGCPWSARLEMIGEDGARRALVACDSTLMVRYGRAMRRRSAASNVYWAMGSVFAGEGMEVDTEGATIERCHGATEELLMIGRIREHSCQGLSTTPDLLLQLP